MHHCGELALFWVLKISKETGYLCVSGSFALLAQCLATFLVFQCYVRRSGGNSVRLCPWLAKNERCVRLRLGTFTSIFFSLDFITKRLLSNKNCSGIFCFQIQICTFILFADLFTLIFSCFYFVLMGIKTSFNCETDVDLKISYLVYSFILCNPRVISDLILIIFSGHNAMSICFGFTFTMQESLTAKRICNAAQHQSECTRY